MLNKPEEIFEEYRLGNDYKSSIGTKGIFEQTAINERFYIGDQWYGAKCGNERPLVRHNVIKRIGNYKISQILGSAMEIKFSANGIPTYKNDTDFFNFDGYFENKFPDDKEINQVMNLLSNYYSVTAERVDLNEVYDKVLRNAYISGTAVVYTYWQPKIATGLYADKNKTVKVEGDICCEVLDIRNIVFADPFCEDLQKQPYIIISSYYDLDTVLSEARINGADIETLKLIEKEAVNNKVKVLTKLYKKYKKDGTTTVFGIKVTQKATVRKEFDTLLSLYPLANFCWERKTNSIYGESEITFLIPNQIAINRMITANVWSAMTTGMPLMVVNGDTVNGKITNEPGQIIKVFGSNEDVSGAIKYVAPPSYFNEFDNTVNMMIQNTMTQSGANEVALGDSKAENASALAAMRDAALLPLQIIKNRFYIFAEDLARIWSDFWISYYGKRMLKISTKEGYNYVSFDAERYKDLIVDAKVEVSSATNYSEKEKIDMLMQMFEKGIITRNQLLERLPKGCVQNISGLINEEFKGEEVNDRV